MSDWGPAEWAIAWQSAPAYVLEGNRWGGRCGDPADSDDRAGATGGVEVAGGAETADDAAVVGSAGAAAGVAAEGVGSADPATGPAATRSAGRLRSMTMLTGRRNRIRRRDRARQGSDPRRGDTAQQDGAAQAGSAAQQGSAALADRADLWQAKLQRAELRQLGTRIRGMAADLAASTCEWLHLLERFDRENGWAGVGIASCAAWLSWTCSVAPGTAREYMRVARALPLLPLIDAEFAAGRLSYSKVRLLVTVAGAVGEKTLLGQAQVQTVAQLERTIRAFRRSNGWSQELRRKASWYWDDDGMLVLSARLPADEGALLLAALAQARDGIAPPPADPACTGFEDGPSGADDAEGAGSPGAGECDEYDEYDGDDGHAGHAGRIGDDGDAGVSAIAVGDPATGAGNHVMSAAVPASGSGGVEPDGSDRRRAALTGVDPLDVARADMLVALAERALAAGDTDSSGDDRHLVVVHADLDQLTGGAAGGVAGTAGGAGGGVADGADHPCGVTDAARATHPTHVPEHAASAAADSVGTAGTAGSIGSADADCTADADCPADTLPGPRCHIENGPGLDRRTLSRIACDAAFVAVLHNVGDGEPLRLGRKTRTISPAQRRALRVRDCGCRFPGCHRRTYLEAHHVRYWSLFGTTDLDNLVLLCRFHHMLIHEGGFSVVADTGRAAARATGTGRAVGAACAAHRWGFRDPAGELVPAVPPLSGNPTDDGPLTYTIPAPRLPAHADNPFGLLPRWRGEPFQVAETVAALARSPRGDV